MCNIGVENSDGELVLLLNDDMEIIDGEWMERMAGHAMLPYTGAVGAKLLYPNSTLIQHTGVFSFDCGPSHALCRYDDSILFNFCRNKIEYNYSAVTAACLMVTREKYLEVGGLDESFAVAYNDVKFCFDLLEKGYYNVVRTDAVLYHHESLSRGSDVLDKAKYERLLKERRRLYDIHPSLEGKDPFYNPNLTMRRGDCTVEGGLDNLENIVLNLQSKDCLEKRKSNFIKGSIENIVVTGKYMLVSGWCINEKSRWNNFIRAKILLVCDDKIFELKTQKMYREHMNELTGINGKNNLSCFRVYFDSNQLPSRKYNIYIKKGKYIFDSSRILEKVKSVY
jgi:GT2 family glycosyltransferase